tara:strand:+ start:246 stop:731 length:486 start_codon:yes stop_codon:yes gene_type:complete
MPSPISFVFTPEERQAAMEEGMRRQAVNEAKRLRGRNGGASFGSKALDIHLLGAAGEMAVASYLGMKHELYKEVEAKRGSDDLPGIDIKTRSKHSYDLIVQTQENPDKKFVLVTIENQQTLLHGWCYGRQAMDVRYWADPARGRPAFFMPKENLHPMETLS